MPTQQNRLLEPCPPASNQSVLGVLVRRSLSELGPSNGIIDLDLSANPCKILSNPVLSMYILIFCLRLCAKAG